jgi:hypothetical protein
MDEKLDTLTLREEHILSFGTRVLRITAGRNTEVSRGTENCIMNRLIIFNPHQILG